MMLLRLHFSIFADKSFKISFVMSIISYYLRNKHLFPPCLLQFDEFKNELTFYSVNVNEI